MKMRIPIEHAPTELLVDALSEMCEALDTEQVTAEKIAPQFNEVKQILLERGAVTFH
jgi:hypothetical protein